MNILFISLGCDKNLSDSEYMIGILSKEGHCIVDTEEEADIIIINSCCFIGDAKEESIKTILEMARLKESGLKGLIVTGCLAERYKDELIELIPEVDAYIGTNSWDNIAAAIDAISNGNQYKSVKEQIGFPNIKDIDRFVTTGGHYAYLKIAEGCDKFCTYCIIPYIRGRYRSVPIEVLIEQAKKLVEGGVKELILIAQETSLYGTDLYGKKSLSRLLDELNKIEDLRWIRIMYCYPEEIDDELISAIKRNGKVVHYLDLPIQHIDDDILARMGRKTTGSDIADLIEHLREEIPDIAIRTSLICGFPGETNEAHTSLLEFLNWAELDRVGAFTYSREEGTLAADFEEQIPEETKISRRNETMELLQEISADINQSFIGQKLLCFVEGYSVEDDIYVARSYRDAPGVDGYVFISSRVNLNSGDFVEVKITGAKDYDLIGELV